MIVPDLPLEEQGELAEALGRHGLALIPLVAPTTPPERRARICADAHGFVYLVSTVGVTGERDELPAELTELISAAKEEATVPVAVGFGISTPEQAGTVGRGCRRDHHRDQARPGGRRCARQSSCRRSRHRLPERNSRRARQIGFRAVQVVLFTVLGGCVMVIAYALGIPGPVDALLFLGGVFTGALLRYAQPLIDWLTRP